MAPSSKKAKPISYVEVTEQKRLNEAREKDIPWKKWGPYLGGQNETVSTRALPSTRCLMCAAGSSAGLAVAT